MASIILKNITKKYEGNVVAVHDFNLKIENNEFIILVGPSGCGKSTTLRMIAGLEDITEGELFIGGELVNNVPPKDRDIAMVFQNYALYPHMTVFKNMAFGLTLRKIPKSEIETKVKEIANQLNIEHLLNRKPKALSGGERQRVALGRAMVRNPAVFLLDEPLSNLDAKLRTQMRIEITKLHKRLGTTFVYVTHDQVEAMTMGDRIVVMKDGFIQQVDTPQNLYSKPNNLFVAGFIGSPQMNFIDANVIEKNGEYYISFHNANIKIKYDMEYIKLISEYVGKTIVMGIRPENIHIVNINESETLEGVVDIAELMGAETLVYIDYCGEKLVIKIVENKKINDGETVLMKFDSKYIHLFDKKTHERIEIN